MIGESIQSIQHLCFDIAPNTPQDKVEAKIQEYLSNYPHIRNPAAIDLLRMTVQLWFRVQATEDELKKCEDAKLKRFISKDLDNMVLKWMRMIGDLGLSYTKQQYIKQKTPQVQAPIERLKMLRQKQESKQE